MNEGYGTTEMPGWYKGSVGYHTDDGRIFQPRGTGHCSAGRETGGIHENSEILKDTGT